MKWLILVLVLGCAHAPATSSYFDTTGRDDVATGGIKLIPIATPKGTFNVWTKRVGNNPRIKVLLLMGGPGASHEFWEALDSYFPAAGIEYYYYDQLGVGFSDNPDAPELWDLARYVEEVEQVRQALKLDHDNFYLVGISWGGLLATEYALKYQQHLKGLVISSMMSSIPAYNDYAKRVLGRAPGEIVAISTAQRTASTGLANSARTLSPCVPTMRPSCAAMIRSITARCAASSRIVPSSSSPMCRL